MSLDENIALGIVEEAMESVTNVVLLRGTVRLWRPRTIPYVSFFFFFKVCLLKPHFTVYETSVLWPGIKATILEWKQAVLTTGLAGKSWYTLFIFMCQPPKHSPWHRVTLKNVCWMSPCYSFNHDWLCDPMDCGPPGFSVHGIPQASIWGGG